MNALNLKHLIFFRTKTIWQYFLDIMYTQYKDMKVLSQIYVILNM